jgi:hypothetical protein
MTPLIIQFVVFWTYVTFVWIYNKKPLPSISDSWYTFPKEHRRLFMVFCVGVAAPIFTFQTDLFFLSGAFLCFTGAAPEFKEKLVKTVHGIGAVGGIGFALVGLLAEGIWFPIACVSIITIALRYIPDVKNDTWWVEIVSFVFIQAGLVVLKFQDIVPEPSVVRILGVV